MERVSKQATWMHALCVEEKREVPPWPSTGRLVGTVRFKRVSDASTPNFRSNRNTKLFLALVNFILLNIDSVSPFPFFHIKISWGVYTDAILGLPHTTNTDMEEKEIEKKSLSSLSTIFLSIYFGIFFQRNSLVYLLVSRDKLRDNPLYI